MHAQTEARAAAPDFSLVDQDGETVTLASFRGEKLVVYFYPKADTPGCTTQSCALRDAEADLGKLGASVVGISPDPPPKQKRFDEKYDLGFPLLADEHHKAAKAWGVWGDKSMYGKKYKGIIRSAFVIDEQGTVVDAFYKVSPKDTVKNVTAALGA